ncbi:MAG: ATP synthase F1 subunit epsilon [Candidatus Uhrbacteria bacterium]
MIDLSIITPEKSVFSGMVDQLTLRTTEGEIAVLPNHAPLVAVLAPGELRLKRGGEEIPMVVAGGFVEVLPIVRRGEDAVTSVAILADDAIRVEEMDIAAIEAARERARLALEEKRHVDETSFADAAAALQKELARLRVARKYRRGSSVHAPSSSGESA